MSIPWFNLLPAQDGTVCNAGAGWVLLALFVVLKPVHRSGSDPRPAGSWARAEFHQIREPSPTMIVERVVFTAEEHLAAQKQIERRAGELWCAGGCRRSTALADWLQAEHEVLAEFVWAYARRHALRQAPTPVASIGIARKKTETRLLKRGRTIAANEPQSTLTCG